MASSDRSPRRYDSREPRDRYRGSDGGRPARMSKSDDPPHSRLFVLCGKQVTEDELKENFSSHGTIEEVHVVKPGVAYVKFAKTSEAASAMEEMNGKRVGGRSLKVLIAHSKDQGSRRDMNEEERLIRLFVVVPKTLEESELREHFEKFGDIEHISIVKDRTSNESKGFAYVKYYRMSHAAKAFESCDRSYKPVFAEPRPPKTQDPFREPRGGGGRDSMRGNDGYMSGPPAMPLNNQLSPFDAMPYRDMDRSGLNVGMTQLTVIASPLLNQDQLWKLCDLIPGLDYCDLREDPITGQGRGVATVVYKNAQSAMYAKEKLHGFEYPLGHRLIVKLGQHDMPREDFQRNTGYVRENFAMPGRDRERPPPPRRISQYRVLVTGLPASGSWQDLKDHMRVAGDILSADVLNDGTGVVEFHRKEDMKNAVKKLDDSTFRSHEGESSNIRVREDYSGSSPGGGGGGGGRSRSRSPHGHRGSDTNDYSMSPSMGMGMGMGMDVQDNHNF